ncbi:MAG: DUF1320 domain-containing protein [PVC group bacterium]|nr:DUF1320 domain-containing protein [PVC group bacterium]MCP4648912.1 DUF1320 domain-containing protein [PVC group bacterium]
MSYCTLTEISTQFPSFPQGDDDIGYSLFHGTCTQNIKRAKGVIDSYCVERYSLPFSPVPPVIRAVAQDIVTYYTFRSFHSGDNQNRSEYLEELNEKAFEILENIRDGKQGLVDTSGSVVPERTTEATDKILCNNKDYQPFFDVDDSKKWKFDDDLKESVNDSRD